MKPAPLTRNFTVLTTSALETKTARELLKMIGYDIYSTFADDTNLAESGDNLIFDGTDISRAGARHREGLHFETLTECLQHHFNGEHEKRMARIAELKAELAVLEAQ